MEIPTATERPTRLWDWCRLLIVLVTLGTIAMLWAPIVLRVPTYEVREGELLVRSVAARVTIPASTPARTVTLTSPRRVVGTAMSGYCVGTFRAAGYRRVSSFTDCSRTVLMFDTPGRPTVISPADPDALLTALRGDTPGVFAPARRPSVDALTILTTLFMMAVALLLFVPIVRMRYGLQGDHLVIRTITRMFRFPLHEVTAELTRGHLALRVFGTGLPGYYTGTYAFTAPQEPSRPRSVQAFATAGRPDRAVLLVHRHTTYYLTPADPDAFLRRLSGQHAGEHATHQVGEGRRAHGT